MRAYRETLDWMYADPKALTVYKEFSGIPEARTKQAVAEFYPKAALDPDRIEGLDEVMADAVAFKFLRAPLAKERLAELFQLQKK